MPEILIVDDDDLARLTLVRMVRSAGYSPVAVKGDEAVRRYQNVPTAAVLLNLTLTETDALEILRQLRTLNPQIAVIGMHVGEFSQEQLTDMGRFLGLWASLQKPFSTTELIRVLENLPPGSPGAAESSAH